MVSPPAGPGPLWQRLAWFVVIWASSVAALAIVGFVLRNWLKAAP